MALQHLRSSTANKRPTPGAMSDGQLALNTNLASPGLFFKDSNGDSIKVGPVHVGTTAPNVSPSVGGQAGNSKGEQWLDTSSSRYVFKIWDGTAWRSEDGEFVNSSGDTMTGALVMDNQQQVRFRETTANGTNFIALQAPAAVASDKTITLPDVTGTVVTTGDTGSVTSTMILDGTILNADINASAAIVDTKLATIATAGKVADSALPDTISSNITGNAATVTTNANLTGDVTSVGNATSIAAGVIVDADINASAAIVDTKLATIATAGKVSGSAITSGAISTSGQLTITNTAPSVRLVESDGTSTHSSTVIARDGNTFQIQTRTSADVFVSTDYVIDSNASGASLHRWFIGASVERMRLSPTGYLKVSNDGTYFDAAGTYHEFRQTGSSAQNLSLSSNNASYASFVVDITCLRSASTAYSFFRGNSGGFSDTEFNLRGDGNAFADGTWTGGGADYAEYFEWSDGNTNAEDRRGISVVLDGNKIRAALPGEDPIGVISGNPSVVGDAAWNSWSEKYLRDGYGTYIQEDYEVEDEDGNTVIQQRRKLNPAYDPDVEYTSREDRSEWDCVGLMGKLRIRKGQPTGSRWIKMRDINSSIEEWLVR